MKRYTKTCLRRVLPIGLAALMATGMFASCSPSETKEPGTTITTTTTELAVTEAVGEAATTTVKNAVTTTTIKGDLTTAKKTTTTTADKTTVKKPTTTSGSSAATTKASTAKTTASKATTKATVVTTAKQTTAEQTTVATAAPTTKKPTVATTAKVTTTTKKPATTTKKVTTTTTKKVTTTTTRATTTTTAAPTQCPNGWWFEAGNKLIPCGECEFCINNTMTLQEAEDFANAYLESLGMVIEKSDDYLPNVAAFDPPVTWNIGENLEFMKELIMINIDLTIEEHGISKGSTFRAYAEYRPNEWDNTYGWLYILR